jgi:hypothetical protein
MYLYRLKLSVNARARPSDPTSSRWVPDRLYRLCEHILELKDISIALALLDLRIARHAVEDGAVVEIYCVVEIEEVKSEIADLVGGGSKGTPSALWQALLGCSLGNTGGEQHWVGHSWTRWLVRV